MNKESEEVKGMSDELFKKKLLAEEKINGKSYHKIYNYLVNSLNSGYAPIIAICGRYGGGKSMSALRIAEILHNEIGVLKGDIKPTKQLVYNVEDFLKAIRDSTRKAIIFDDCGVSLKSTEWHSKFNQAVVDTISTQRNKENPYIFVLGKLYKLTKQIRDIIDLRGVVNKSNNGQPVVKFTIMKAKYGKIESRGKNRSQIYLTKRYAPKLPPKELIEEYRKKELKFKRDLIKEKIKEIRQEKKEKQRKQNIAQH